MKCAQCVISYVNDQIADRDNGTRTASWIAINQAETTLDGTALCIKHLIERAHPERPHQ